jgi:hypothetical protein
MVTMSQKSSVPQVLKSVSQVLMPDMLLRLLAEEEAKQARQQEPKER